MTLPDLDVLFARAEALRRQGPAGRYAPSPTGDLHAGNLRTALLAWLQARQAGARFILRIEDLDRPRVRPGSTEKLLADLRWLGLDWDEGPEQGGPSGPYLQSERLSLYQAALQRLQDRRRVYPCYCSRRDIAQAASAPHGPTGIIYPGTCRALSPAERAARQARRPERLPAWRLVVEERTIHFDDRVCGPQHQHLGREVGDFVLRRADDIFAYQLAVVLDDALMGITDVVRGDDLLDSTARQIALFEIFEQPAPRFWHVPLMRDATGERMSKRDGSDALDLLKDQGMDAPAVIGYLAESLGWVEPGQRLSAPELLQDLGTDAIANLGPAPERS
ncbi:tRNA glutamyl-Q(34) synthetase GluQRS [Lujinxingia litoralis]|uniref:Glutamyl-Q tRNA(Asp) synthetase n=1 Tax=Lujinxingia litoralis TaxID=2211119 RepID=A0A328C614_9DELT|nr:tRNA glutamyl-Q(34) synthetase GluQRS [Lujinxingia litoralis]RAL22262.1 tRNA glutamyl-Q(34) synthetase GluQRS [Lujinxingia litoralis]